MKRLLAILTIFVLAAGVMPCAAAQNAAEDGARHGIKYYLEHKSELEPGWWDYAALSSAGYRVRGFSFNKAENNQAAKAASNVIADVLTGQDPAEDIAALRNFSVDGKYGTAPNDHIWSIIALCTAGAEFDRESAAEHLLSFQLPDGGFAFAGDSSDADMTGMALTALALLRGESGVDEAISKAVNFLSRAQQGNGGFKDRDYPEYSYVGTVNPNSTAAALIGLIDAGVDITGSEWIKGGRSIIDALLDFKADSGGFYIPSAPGGANQLATAQALVALEAYLHGRSVFCGIPKAEYEITPDTENPTPVGDGGAERKAVSLTVIGTDGVIAKTPDGFMSSSTTAFELLSEYLRAQGIALEAEDTSQGKHISAIGGQKPHSDGYWAFSVNGQIASVGADSYVLDDGDSVLFHYEGYHIYHTPAGAGESFSIYIKRHGYDFGSMKATSVPIEGAIVEYNGETKTTDKDGCASFTASPGARSAQVTVLKETDPLLWADFSESMKIELSKKISIKIAGLDGFAAADDSFTTDAETAFEALSEFAGEREIELDYENGAFGIFIKSIAGQRPQKCSYWAFAVNGQMAPVGAGEYEIKDGDRILFYYRGFYAFVDESSVKENKTFDVKVAKISYDFAKDEQIISGIADAQVSYGGVVKRTNADGVASFTAVSGSRSADVLLEKEKDSELWEDFTQTIEVEAEPEDTGVGGSLKYVYLKVTGKDGVMFAKKKVALESGDTPITVLQRNIPETCVTGSGESAYVVSINGLSEFDEGPESGWKYRVNGNVKNYSAGAYELKSGDFVEWFYVYSASQTKPGTTTKSGSVGVKKTADVTAASVRFSEKKGIEKLAEDLSIDGFAPLVLAYANRASGELYKKIIDDIAENGGSYRKVTDTERMAINAAALGLDPENIGGCNLIKTIIEHENIEMQGLNGVIFGLIALDCTDIKGSYRGPNTKDVLIGKILSSQKSDGGFALSDGGSEVDITAFAITALAAHSGREDVKACISKALDWLDTKKTAAGGYKSEEGLENCESLAWVIIAKSAAGIDVLDEVKLLEGYELENGYFSHIPGGGADILATQQALMALAAYDKYKGGRGRLFEFEKSLGFSDIASASPWAFEYIDKAVKRGIVKGDGSGRLSPKKQLTRAEFIAMLLRSADVEPDESISVPFRDVSPSDWFYGYAAKGYSLGLIKGYSEDCFAGTAAVSRQELAVIVARLLNLSGGGRRPKDLQNADEWAKAAVEAVFTEGVMEGDGGYFNPKSVVTREQAIKIIVLIQGVKK